MYAFLGQTKAASGKSTHSQKKPVSAGRFQRNSRRPVQLRALAYLQDTDRHARAGQEKALPDVGQGVFQFAKTMPLSPDAAGNITLSEGTFSKIYTDYVFNPMSNASRRSLQAGFLQEHGVTANTKQVSINIDTLITELQRINDTCLLFKELAGFKRNEVCDETVNADGSKTYTLKGDTDLNKFIDSYKETYKKGINVDIVTAYKDVIRCEIKSRDYNGQNEKEYQFNRNQYKFEDIDPASPYVLYRSMKKEDYQLLLNYFKIKGQIEPLYNKLQEDIEDEERDNTIGQIRDLLSNSHFVSRKVDPILPLGGHLGNFEQALTYISGKVLVKFRIKEDKKAWLIDTRNHVNVPRRVSGKGGGEGSTIISDQHRDDKIGFKLEDRAPFSYNIGKSVWIAIKFLSFVDSIEVFDAGKIIGQH